MATAIAQISATFARNNFKNVCDQVEKEGKCFVIKQSVPKFAILSMNEYQKLTNPKIEKKNQKISLNELRENSPFRKYDLKAWANKYEQAMGQSSSSTAAKNWTKFVD